MTFKPASREERMAACASRACAPSVSFTCAPVSVPPRGMLSRMDFHCSLVRSLASWAACLTPSRNFSSNASSSLSPFFTLDSSKLAPPSVRFLQRDLVGFDDLEQGIIHPRERVILERVFSTSILPSPTPTLTPSVTLRTTLL